MQPRIYHMAPELRRSAIYAMVGFAVLAGATYRIGRSILERDFWPTFLICTVFAAISVAMIFPLRWALRMDDQGVAQRLLFGWDQWHWSDFSSGRIGKKHFTFFDPQRPAWTHTFTIELLSDFDRAELLNVINERYRLPAPPMLPERLEIRYGFRSRLEIQRNGIRLRVHDETRSYGWQEVQRVRIVRIDPLRRDFGRLVLCLPGHEIELGPGKEHAWSGATYDEVSEFVVSHMPAERVDVDIAGDSPRRAEDVQKELKKLRTAGHQMNYCVLTSGVAYAGLMIWMAVEGGVLKALVMSAFALVLIGPLYWSTRRLYTQKCMQLEKCPAELQNRRVI
jgi:hypothetical protein